MKNVLKHYFVLLALTALLTIFSISVSFAGTLVKLQTNLGDIVVELEDEKAPKSVANFLSYVKDGFYSGTIFHRVIDGFMVQGGGFCIQEQELWTGQFL